MHMAKYLVIVESPAKVKTIKKFLGANYEVMASQGHVRDLPKSQLGFDPEHDYEPKYITIRGKGDLLASLRKEVKKADKIYLATDPDREGEAISWHLYYALKLESKKVYRITFNEITKNAVKESLKNAREIDMNLVDAQQARRMLDRMVGYRISPLLWAKIKRGLSAGRVQSVALRIICDREDEINAFIPEEYWSLDVNLKVKGEKKPICAKYYGTTEKKQGITSKEQADSIMDSLNGAKFEVKEVRHGERVKKAPLPFTTSTLQQEASKVLNFSTQKTMRLAQQLYEGVDIKGEGTVGLITYLRTDSTRVSEEAETQAAEFIDVHYGEKYKTAAATQNKNRKKIQDAHEAIRPTDLNRMPIAIKEQLPRDLFRLYQLIWKRFVASRMSAAQYDTTSVKIQAKDQIFTLAASRMRFDGFMSVYTQEDDKEEENVLGGNLDENSVLEFQSFDPKQHFTQPPAHYTEASLVRAMEELGIPAEMKADIGKHAYYPNSEYVYPIESDELQEKFYDHVTTMTLVRYYLRHPKDMLTMMNRAAQESVTLSTSFMTYTDALYSDNRPLHRMNLWCNLRSIFAARAFWVYVLLYGTAGVFCQTLICRKKTQKQTKLLAMLFLCVMFVGVMQYPLSVIGNGFADNNKQMYTFMLCHDLLVVAAGVVLVRRLIPARRRRSPRLRLSRARPGRLSTIREIISTPTLLTSIKTRVRR